MLGSLQGAFKVTTLHFSGFGLVHDSFASLLIPLTLVLRFMRRASSRLKDVLHGEYKVLIVSLRGSIRRTRS